MKVGPTDPMRMGNLQPVDVCFESIAGSKKHLRVKIQTLPKESVDL